jgi:hypothetical protein
MLEIQVHAIKWAIGNSSECHYRPILMKFGTQTKTDMLSSKITKAEVYGHFQDGRRCYLGKSSACYKMGNYRPISACLS